MELVKNYDQVYKSLAVWLPVIASAIYVVLKDETVLANIPLEALPIVVGISSALGWVIKQNNIKKVQ